MKNLKEELKTRNELMNDISVDFSNDYFDCSSYVCDAISEHADSQTSIYYSDIEEYASNNFERISGAISEFGWDGCGEDIYKAAQLAEYTEHEEEIYSDLENIAECWLIKSLIKYYSVDFLADEIFDDLMLYADADNNGRCDDAGDAVKDYIENIEVDYWETEEARTQAAQLIKAHQEV